MAVASNENVDNTNDTNNNMNDDNGETQNDVYLSIEAK